jgi:hypothetical protein
MLISLKQAAVKQCRRWPDKLQGIGHKYFSLASRKESCVDEIVTHHI